MAAVAKNLYELLGNDHDEDSDREPDPPVKVVDKTPARTDKRNAPREAPAAPVGTENRRGGRSGISGNEGAFRDRNVGATSNRGKPTEDIRQSDRPPRAQGTYEGRGRGGARGRGRGGPGDRHSRTTAANSDKQAGHGWGENEAGAELADEQAAEVIAKVDGKEALTGDGEGAPVNEAEPAADVEPEDNSISYTEYLAQLAEKKLALGNNTLSARKPNEGSKGDKKWDTAKALTKEEQEEFMAGSGGKAKRERERRHQKQVLEIDQRFVEAPERGGRGGGGRGRGDGTRGRGEGYRGRGEGFRGRGDGAGRGGRGDGFRGRGRGDGPGSFRGGGRDGPRGGGAAASINTDDQAAFPSLGSS